MPYPPEVQAKIRQIERAAKNAALRARTKLKSGLDWLKSERQPDGSVKKVPVCGKLLEDAASIHQCLDMHGPDDILIHIMQDRIMDRLDAYPKKIWTVGVRRRYSADIGRYHHCCAPHLRRVRNELTKLRSRIPAKVIPTFELMLLKFDTAIKSASKDFQHC